MVDNNETSVKNKGLYALVQNDDINKGIKIGKITGSILAISKQYATRYNPDGYTILRYWDGELYYKIEHQVLNNESLAPYRIKSSRSGRLTEWFTAPIELIEQVVNMIFDANNIKISSPLTISYVKELIDNILHNERKNAIEFINFHMKQLITYDKITQRKYLIEIQRVCLQLLEIINQQIICNIATLATSVENIDKIMTDKGVIAKEIITNCFVEQLNVLDRISNAHIDRLIISNTLKLIGPHIIKGTEYVESVSNNSSNVPNINEFINNLVMSNNNEIIDTNDKYFAVTLTAHKDDGSKQYIIVSLIENFKKLFPSCFPAKSWIYCISKDEIPFLFGMIRYDDIGKYNIGPKTTHIRNVIQNEYTKIKTKRDFQMVPITKYINKKQTTKKHYVTEIYNYIEKTGEIIGDELNKFL